MNFRALRYFQVVAETRSVSRAARQLRVAQSAISRQIQNLEDDLGVPLIVRQSSGIVLTEAGAVLVRRAGEILRDIDETRSALSVYADQFTGQVGLGVPSAAGALLVPPLLDAVRSALPLVTLSIVEGNGRILMEKLRQGAVSMALIYDPERHDDVSIDPLLVERVHLFGLPGSFCSKAGTVTIEDVVTLPLILHARPHYIRTLLEDAAAEKKLALRPHYEVDSLSVIRALVWNGAGYGVLTPAAAHGLPGETTFASRPIMTPGMSLTLAIVRRTATGPSGLLNAIASLIKLHTRTLIDDGTWPSEPKFVAGQVGGP